MLLSPFQTQLTLKSPPFVWLTVAVAALAVAWPGQVPQLRLAAPFMVFFCVAISYLFWRICLTLVAKLTASKFGYYYSLFVYYLALAAVPLSGESAFDQDQLRPRPNALQYLVVLRPSPPELCGHRSRIGPAVEHRAALKLR